MEVIVLHLWVHGQGVLFNGEPLIRYFGSPSIIHINGCQVKGVRPNLALYLSGRSAPWAADLTGERHNEIAYLRPAGT
jgi:hypothetical protein